MQPANRDLPAFIQNVDKICHYYLFDLSNDPVYKLKSTMRRVFAITSIAALILTMVSPVFAAACEGMGKVSICHRNAAGHEHHCDAMMEQQEEIAPDAGPAFKSVPAKCPMQCCMQSQAGNGPAILSASIVARSAISENTVEFPQAVFTSNGFSSHTDRGPPLA